MYIYVYIWLTPETHQAIGLNTAYLTIPTHLRTFFKSFAGATPQSYQNFVSVSCISFPEGNPIQNTKVNFCVFTLIRNCMYRRRIFYALYIALLISNCSVSEFIGPVFAKTSLKRKTENERFGHLFAKTGSINSVTVLDWTAGEGSAVRRKYTPYHFPSFHRGNPLQEP